MGLVLLQFIPLALAAITPTMVILVTVLLAGDGGLTKALAVVTGRFTAHFIIAFILIFLLSQLPETASSSERSESDVLPILFLIAGIVLLLLAARLLISGEKSESDQPTSPFGKRIDKINSILLFVLSFGVVWVSLRLLSLKIAGAAIIEDADLSDTQTWIMIVVLCLCLIWPMLVPLGLYAAMGDRRQQALVAMRDWLTHHERAINTAVLAFFGGILVAKGIGGL